MPLDQIDIEEYDPHTLQPLKEKEMSFVEHLEELRWHIIRSVVVVLLISIVLVIFKDWFFETIILGPTQKEFWTYQTMCGLSESLGLGTRLCFEPVGINLVALKLGDAFLMTFKLAFVCGFIFAFPYIFWEIWRFVSPGLYTKEQNSTTGIVLIASVLFTLGALFGYFIVAPFGTNFLAGFSLGGVRADNPTLESYINYLIMFILPAGIIFELPIIVYLLSKLGLLTPEFMRQYRRHAVVVILVIASLMTPPDILTQFLIGVPLYFLYEISIFVSAYVVKKEAAKLA